MNLHWNMISLVLALALLAAGLVPQGFMPDFSGKAFSIVICSGLDSKTITVDENGKKIPAPHAKSHACPYASVQSSDGPVHAPDLAASPQNSGAFLFAVSENLKSFSQSSYRPRGPPFSIV